ncbi:MAG: hypothetical protein V3T30_08720 [Thermodesulfobacteriota bacterium]
MKPYLSRYSLISIVFIAVLISGCVNTQKMAINKKTKVLDLSEESIALMTLRMSNQVAPSHQPIVSTIIVCNITDVSIERCEKKRSIFFKTDKPDKKYKKVYNEQLVSMRLAPGTYKIFLMYGLSGGSPLIRGNFFVQIRSHFEIKSNEIVYLGQIDAVLRKRVNKDEERGGPIIPLLDQAVSGFYKGTFDVSIIDNYATDINSFKKKHPLLNAGNVKIEKNILSPWKRPIKGSR